MQCVRERCDAVWAEPKLGRAPIAVPRGRLAVPPTGWYCVRVRERVSQVRADEPG